MSLSHLSAVLAVIVCCMLRQSKPATTECISNKDCPSDRLCAEFQCINPCLLNLCDSPVDCKVTNHIPVCSCKGGPAGRPAGSANKRGIKKFLLYKEQINWMAALLKCSSQGMNLATIESQQEQDRLNNQIKQEFPEDNSTWWWLGASDLLREGQFVWTSTGKRFKYINFADGQPNNFINEDKETEDCMGLYNGGTEIMEWYDGTCSYNQDFICEYFD